MLAGVLVWFVRSVAHAVCNPSLVRLLGETRDLVQIRRRAGPRLGQYYLEWFGHSSFLIHSGSQTKVVTDPNFNVTPGIEADAVTVSNDHFTHNNVEAVAGDPLILRGITRRQVWKPIRTNVKDIVIVNIPSQRGLSYAEVANSIFIFEMGSLCLAHLGNIGHLLTPEQEEVMQRVDVIMIPIDAMNNLGFEDLLKLIAQVKPPVVIPMHYDAPHQADLFAGYVGDRYPIRRVGGSRLVLSRPTLPKTTEILVLTHPRPELSFE